MSPPASPTTSPIPNGMSKSSSGTGTPLSLDLSSLPPLVAPSPPSNTLLITNLNNPSIFHPESLQKIRQLLSEPIPLNSFSPLRAFHRIIVSYPTIDAALQTRLLLDGTSTSSISPPSTANIDSRPAVQRLSEDRIRIYFGPPTPVAGQDEEIDRHLKAPSLGKLLFISPPPSPPYGWEIKEEDPPNKDTHAEDLQRALAGLNGSARFAGQAKEEAEEMDVDAPGGRRAPAAAAGGGGGGGVEKDGFGQTAVEGSRRQDVRMRKERSASMTMVYHPRDHSDREDLPAVMVEDTTPAVDEEEEGMEGVISPIEGGGPKKIMAHTARPPVELMGD